MTTNPYSGLPDHQFWRRAMTRVEPFAVDPVTRPKFVIGRTERVATAGSCFAQHISRSLQRSGFGYWVTESAPDAMPPSEAKRLNYGVFSCRYGNLYTARQLLQLFGEAFGHRTPSVEPWARADGRWADPFRPQIEPDGHASPEDVRMARAEHLEQVRRMFAGLDVLVFTLGLTEAWRAKADGSVFPLAPGVAAGSYESTQHEFINFSAREVVADLEEFLALLAGVNIRARVILTVSPVPLIATYEPRHVLVSTTYSKAVLRVAAQEVSDAHEQVDYFPSFEIVTGNHSRGRYFEDDLREVSAPGVAHAMRTFMRHYAAVDSGAAVGSGAAEAAKGERSGMKARELPVLARADDDIICDEEAIDAIRA